ncbi:MAG: hypothetical protein WCM76_16595 [Bacteroidota bacterium]
MKKQHFFILFLILVSGFGIYSGIKSLIKGKEVETEWTQTERDNQVRDCIFSTKEMGEKYPEIVEDYCECSTDKVTSSMSKEEYDKISSLPVDEQRSKIMPIIKDCFDNFNRRINEAELKKMENAFNGLIKKK